MHSSTKPLPNFAAPRRRPPLQVALRKLAGTSGLDGRLRPRRPHPSDPRVPEDRADRPAEDLLDPQWVRLRLRLLILSPHCYPTSALC
ncbi:hypothetical protein L596_005341 [Steinernema carpocapsae]|uniref:Uncharacterized protein n=1 Tax=Steinernema carpocapsae TaxID=34508 RepID=A0A4U8V363_STECR|nr:hypothetical protein L596_005341 [Steinernema carpocapsae]